jgi:hypothetical protein
VPSEPAYLRVKLRRRVQRLGAIGLKGAVYLLPDGDGSMAGFKALRREIVADGGEATICRAKLVDGMADADLVARFNQERDTEYAALLAACSELERRWVPDADKSPLVAERGRLFGRLEEILARDFFGCPRCEAAMQDVERLAGLNSGLAA